MNINISVKKTLLLACAGVFLSPSVVYAESLEQAVSVTLAQHPQVENALAALKGAEQAKDQEFSGYFPELQVSATGGRIFGDNSTSRGLSVTRGEGYSYLWEGSVSATQMLFDGFGTQNRVGAARADMKAAEYSLGDIRETLTLRTTQTYIELLRVYRGLKLLKGQNRSVQDYLSRITTMVDDGAADEAELQQAKDVAIILDNFIADYEGQARSLEADYIELTGHLPEGTLETPPVSEELIPANQDEAIEAAKQAHPLLSSVKFQSQSAQRSVDAEKSAYIPQFDGELSFLKSDKADILGGEVKDGRAVVRMNWGFETGGAQQARVRQRTYEYKEALARISEIERQVERNIRQAYAEMATAKRQLSNQQRRHELNKKLLETYEVQFEGARISVLQLMQADNQVLITRLEALNAKSRVALAQYGVLAAMGQLQNSLNVKTASVTPRREP